MRKPEKITIESYDKTVDEYIKNVDSLHPINESKKFLSLLGKGARILDLGCGPGRDAKVFVKQGLRIIGIDLSKNMVSTAKKRVKNGDFHVMDIRKLRFNDKYFDGIWASAIFLHIPKKDILEALQESFRVLKKGGILYSSVKKGYGEIFKPDKRYNNIKKFWSFFQKEEIERELKNAGFTIQESYTELQKISYATNPWMHILCRK